MFKWRFDYLFLFWFLVPCSFVPLLVCWFVGLLFVCYMLFVVVVVVVVVVVRLLIFLLLLLLLLFLLLLLPSSSSSSSFSP